MLDKARSDMHHDESREHRYVADAIGEEAPSFADPGDQQTSDGGSDDTGGVEHRRIERDGIDQIGAADHLLEKRLAGRNVKRVDHAQRRRKYKDVPDLYMAGERERGEN